MSMQSKLVSVLACGLGLAGCQSTQEHKASIEAQPDASHDTAQAAGKTVSLEAAMQPTYDPAAFPADRTANLWVKGISCPYCVTNIDQKLLAMPGVEKVHVDLPTGQVRVALDTMYPATRTQLTRAIEESGFTLDRVEMPK